MIKEAVFHHNMEPFVYPALRNKLVIRIRTGSKDISRCRIIHFDRTKPDHKKEQDLSCILREKLFDYYEVVISFKKVARYHKYFFYLEDKEGTSCYYNINGFSETVPADGYFEYLYANEKDAPSYPAWAEGAVYYQIFPERFANGSFLNDPPNCVPWGSRPTRDNYMGGDLSGILSKLPYLKQLGIECLYLTPVFEGDFNHKYATADYFKIDPAFGTEKEFKELVNAAHAIGIRVILDGVFNHTGIHFKAFQDILKNQDQSVYKDWYYINQYPVTLSHHDYECVGAYKWMPKLNSSNRDVRAFILKIMEYWIKEFEIDGWRLDVADEVDGTVWQQARLLKEKYPDILLIGETWGYGGRLLQPGQMDSVMNYLFRDAVKDFFGTGAVSVSEFDSRINHMLSLHKRETNMIQYNLLDSHDTERFLADCGGNKENLKLAAAFQFLFPGAPAIYYGDEAGMTGDNDPDCRKAMVFGKDADQTLIDYYQYLIKLRKEEACIRKGNFASVHVDDKTETYGFVRCFKNEAVYVLINKGNEEVSITCPVLKPGTYRELSYLTARSTFNVKEQLCSRKTGQNHFYNEDIMEYRASVSINMKPCSVKIIKQGG